MASSSEMTGLLATDGSPARRYPSVGRAGERARGSPGPRRMENLDLSRAEGMPDAGTDRRAAHRSASIRRRSAEVREMSREYCAVPLPPAARVVAGRTEEGSRGSVCTSRRSTRSGSIDRRRGEPRLKEAGEAVGGSRRSRSASAAPERLVAVVEDPVEDVAACQIDAGHLGLAWNTARIRWGTGDRGRRSPGTRRRRWRPAACGRPRARRAIEEALDRVVDVGVAAARLEREPERRVVGVDLHRRRMRSPRKRSAARSSAWPTGEAMSS